MSRWLEAARAAEEQAHPPQTKPTEPLVPPVSSVLSVLSKGVEPKIRAPDLDAFEERAAIAEHDGGQTREEAERMAAEAMGFADPSALFAAAVDGWRRHLEALARCETSKRGQDCIAAALAFIRDGWAQKATALGWPEIELFGADPRAPWERQDQRGVAYLPFTPSAVTASCVTYAGTGTTPMRRWRASQADGAALPWDGTLKINGKTV